MELSLINELSELICSWTLDIYLLWTNPCMKVFKLTSESSSSIHNGGRPRPGTNQLLTCKAETYHLSRCTVRILLIAPLTCSSKFTSALYELHLNENLLNIKNLKKKISYSSSFFNGYFTSSFLFNYKVCKALSTLFMKL